MHPTVIRLYDEGERGTIAGAINRNDSPLVIVADKAPPEQAPEVSGLLRRNFPVAGVLEHSLQGAWAEAFLACDALFSAGPAISLTFPGSGSWPALLAIRLGRGALNRVIFSGGEASFQEMEKAGWCRRGGIKDAVHWAEGKSAEAQRLLRPLLYCQTGLGEASRLALERAAFGLAWAGGDAREGARAFLEKREPAFGTGFPGGAEKA